MWNCAKCTCRSLMFKENTFVIFSNSQNAFLLNNVYVSGMTKLGLGFVQNKCCSIKFESVFIKMQFYY